MTRFKHLTAAFIAVISVGLTGCLTPEEFHEFERTTGIELTPEQEAAITANQLLEEQRAITCAAASAEADALAPEHDYLDLDTAMRVYELIARGCRRWSDSAIAGWANPVRGIMFRESAGCYNLQRGAAFADHTGAGCALKTPGHGTDSGYGQVLMSVHASWLCPQEGLCTPADVTSSPTKSMTAFLALIERAGRQGWCWTQKLQRGALCRSMLNLARPVRL